MYVLLSRADRLEGDASIGDIIEIAGTQIFVQGDAVTAVVGIAAVRERERRAIAGGVRRGGAVGSRVLRCLHPEEAFDGLVVGIGVKVKDVVSLGRLSDAQVVYAERGTGHGGRCADSQQCRSR